MGQQTSAMVHITGLAFRRLRSSHARLYHSHLLATKVREVAPLSVPPKPTVTVTDNKSLGMPELAQLAVNTGMGPHKVAGHQFLHARMATDKGRDNVEAALARQIGDKKVANDTSGLHEAKNLLMRDMLALADRNGM